ncbi:MAG: M64 family metallo-endopeptidase [Salinivirgaceae bacterium]|jgi:hypothetical protein|nr:M64 family metallo-endopeptidase [Salinivirgaceae bacterium]
MKKLRTTIVLVLVGISLNSFAKEKEQIKQFNTFFEDKTLRIDYLLTGDANSEEFVLKQLKKQAIWAGPKRLPNGHDLDMGTYRVMIYDDSTNQLIYKKGFCSLFNEYQKTEKAKTTKESYYHVNLIPFPKQKIKYVLEKRNWDDGKFYTIKDLYIDPTNYFIIEEQATPYNFSKIHGNNNINNKIDIAFIAEGYTKKEMKKFRADVKRIWYYFITIQPFDQYKDEFNVYAVECPSVESGTDNPGEHIYRNTALNSTFYTFDTDRYLTTKDLKSVHDAAAVVPYDHIFIVINSAKYGGGGFYNYYSATTSNHNYSLKVAIHEFGHSFAGLGDEYYSSDVAFNGFYNLKTEPWEPNITTLVDVDKKWKDMVSEGVPIPTERIYNLKDSVGVYEGGGYSAEGIYSPYQNCRMKSNVPKGFCPVCSKAIKNVIEYYTK